MSKFKFVKIRRNDFPDKPECWVLLIDDISSLMAYVEIKQSSMVKTYFSAKDKSNGHAHFTALEYAIAMKLESTPNRKNLIDDIFVVHDTFIQPLHKIFEREGCIHVNPAGGFYSPNWVDHTILETIEKDVYEFPTDVTEKKPSGISITKWENGTHYYARIGEMNVIWNGAEKWNSYDDAHEAATKFWEKLKGV